LWGFIAVLLAFGAGFGWQYYEAGLIRDELAQTRQELMVERLRVRLGQAAISAQNGDYEAARQRMSDFFTRLDASLADLPEAVARMGTDFLTVRDEVITGLSRSNPEYAGVLYNMLDRFRSVAGLEEQMTPAPPPAGEPTMTPAETDTTPPMPEPAGGGVGDTTG
jgi:hypothetical protein